MNTPMAALALLIALLGGSFALPQNTGREGSLTHDPRDYSELNKAPARARSRMNPFQNDPDAVASGRILFEDHCMECHGTAGMGGKKAPSLQSPEVQNATGGALFWLLTNGVPWKGMPVWSKLPEAQRWQLVRYLQSLGVNDASQADKKP